ncbi:hypothetical protein O181_005911 [Austropuccinia psidii MF-1]|uniref:Flap endonuclease 1 n=1 Tax=Austropuccinia psidii MF-1 TaxID=1389203 RepID=A0A9Q3GGA6_9BASI|nr:hypothetical protein [Austropuccinia psidii MF-1]
MAVTGHFLDQDFNLTSILLGLSEIEGPHSGVALATHFLSILHQFDLEDRITSITTDNASSNSSMVNEIASTAPTFNASTHAIGCMAHVLHLAAQDGLKALSEGVAPTTCEQEEPPGPMAIVNIINTPDGSSLRYDSIISRVARLASYLRQSPQRREKFAATVKLNYDGPKSTNANTLLCHVRTCWNSTYDMLERALCLREAYNQYCSPENMESFRLSPIEWEKVEVMVNFLQPLYEATNIICGSKYPTINQALPLYILLIKRLNQACQQYDVAPIEAAALAMTSKLKKYLTLLLHKTPVICASILDPRCKMKFFTAHDTTLAQFGTSANALAKIFEDEAQKQCTSVNNPPPEPERDGQSGLFDEMYSAKWLEGGTVESEIQRFFAEPPEPKSTDILLFWKSRGGIFPHLSLMACKYLAIPATSAPSERVFSCGRKILTYQRASLSSTHVEQLSCLKDWFKEAATQQKAIPENKGHLKTGRQPSQKKQIDPNEDRTHDLSRSHVKRDCAEVVVKKQNLWVSIEAMGIKGLSPLINDLAPNAVTQSDIKTLFGRKVAIDASMSIYQFLIAVRQQDGQQLMNDSGETTSHLMGLFYRTIRMVDNGIKPAYVFDGKPPAMKAGVLAKRLERREEAKEAGEEAKETGTVEELDKLSRRTVKVTKEHNEECRRLLTLMGIPWVIAPCEAEAQCAELCRGGLVYAAGSEDMDTLTFGAPLLLRHLTFSEARKLPILTLNLEKVLQGLELTMEQFIEFCVLCGCDYVEPLRGVAAKTALKLIKEHGSIDSVVNHLREASKNPPPEDWPWADARQLFLQPEVTPASDLTLEWKMPDVDGLIQFLVKEKGFDEDRVKKGAAKLAQAMTQKQQGRLDGFFKPLPKSDEPASTGKKRKGEDKKADKAKKTKASTAKSSKKT